MTSKKFGYLLFLTTPALPVVSAWLGMRTGATDLSAWFTVAWMFGLVPVADYLLGVDTSNPDEAEAAALEADPYYKVVLALSVPLMIATLVGGAWWFVHAGFGWAGRVGWTTSIGLVSGAIAINTAHELIHRRSRPERLAGGFLLSLVCYASFKVEHIRGHHVHVATPADNSTARFGESLYAFLTRAPIRNFVSAWRLEARRLKRLGVGALHWRNELVWWYLASVSFAVAFALWLGLWGVAFFAMQSLVAVSSLEIVNYLEHYGLERRRRSDGSYERTNHRHSWNSDFRLTNALLFQLQRHSDHHEHPWRPYQALRHYDDSPQLPAGYASMMLLALVPPLWRRVMHPRIAAFRAASEHG